MRNSVLLLSLLAAFAPGLARAEAVEIGKAWAPPTPAGGDSALYLEAQNAGAADAILRVRCGAVNFTELRVIDKGEGFPSSRVVKAIPIAAETTTTLGPDGFNVHLLQATRALAAGETFDCMLRLQSGAQRKVDVTVKPLAE